MDGGIRRNGGSSPLIRHKFPLGPVFSRVGRGTTPGRPEKKPTIVTAPEPRFQMRR
jgi:hypothetical protein